MAHVDCPKCSQRLRVPDSQGPLTLRCPACGGVFDNTWEGESDQPPGAAQAAAKTALADLPPESVGVLPRKNEHILSAADEAMLRDFGSGSGLLELTREAVSVSPKLDVHNKEGVAATAPAEAPAGDTRQFQLVATALTLANKLVNAHKAELLHSRRTGRLAWILLGAMTLVASGLLAWGVNSLGNVNLERVKAGNLSISYEQDRSRLANDLKNAEAEATKMQADLTAAREQLAESKATATVLSASVKDAKASLATANTDLGSVKSDLATAKAKNLELAAELERWKSPPTTQSARSN